MKVDHRNRLRIPAALLGLAWLALGALPFSAAAACAGKYAALQSNAGKSIHQTKFLATPFIASRLARLPLELRLHLQRNLDVSGPLQLAACHLVVTGNLPHRGTEEDAILDADLGSGTVTAAIHSGGRIDIYVLADPTAGVPQVAWTSLPRRVREWAVQADMGFPHEPARNLAQPPSARIHTPSNAPATANTGATAARKIDFSKDAVKPTPAQAAAIRRVASDAFSSCNPAREPCYSLALADLNDDGHADLLVQYAYATGYCGSAGCSGVMLLATPHGYADKAIDLPNIYGEVDILQGKHGGMHDLRYGDSPRWTWDGSQYQIQKADRPGSTAPAWKTRQAAGHPLMAVATPIDSTIKNLLLFCEAGHPLLAMVTKAPRSAVPATLTFVFNGWTVPVALQQNHTDARLWVAELSHADLPEWLAHRGRTATTQALASAAETAFLRINGRMEGEISLQDSAVATRTALSGCYRY